ncbi:MAG: DUF3450 domain-containing protein [Opitutales bacterium]|nr:DUF3450 domain-containing protein [Opitutales bacterium]
MNYFKVFSVGAFLILGTAALVGQTQTSKDRNFSMLEEWVEVEKTLTKERYDWEIQKQSIVDVISVYKQELEMLNEKIVEAQELTSSADEKKADLLEEQEQFREVEAKIEQIIIAQESQLKSIVKRLPKPLREEIAPLSQRIPADSEKTSLSISQRLQSIVGILTQIDKFNTTVEVVPEQRKFESGDLVQVKTIYFGLSAAYYADHSGDHAGYGRPAADEGWDWTSDASIAVDVLDVIAMFEGGTTEIDFTSLPIKINSDN